MIVFAVSWLQVGMFAKEFKVATAEWSPYAYQDSKRITGIAVDVLLEIFKRSGDQAHITLYPAKRLNILFDMGEIDVNFADSPLWNEATDNPNYLFSDPYLSVREYVYLLKKRALKVTKPDDLRGKTVGIAMGYYYGMFEEAFEKGWVKKEEAPSNEALLKKLLMGRTDAIFMDEMLFSHLLSKLKLDQSQFVQSMELTQAPLALKVRIEQQESLPRINQAIAAMKDDGTMKKILDQYGAQ